MLISTSLCDTQELEGRLCSSRSVPQGMGTNFGRDWRARLSVFGDLVSPVTTVYPCLVSTKASGMVANFGAEMSSRENRKRREKAQKDLTAGKMKKANKLEGKMQWVSVGLTTLYDADGCQPIRLSSSNWNRVDASGFSQVNMATYSLL
jgi:hypothetical protein